MVNFNGSTKVASRVLLPTGVTTSPRPRIEWKPLADAEAFQVRVRDSSIEQGPSTVWESGAVPSSVTHVYPGEDLPSHSSLFAEIRVRVADAWSNWGGPSLFRIEPICPLHESIVVYDLHYTREMSPLLAFAHAHLVSALQGLVNRFQPRLYVKFVQASSKFAIPTMGEAMDIDQFWLDRMKSEDGWLGESVIRNIYKLPELLELFRDAYNGVVVWDPAVPATSNVASTIAGAESLLPVPFCCEPSGLYRELIIDLEIPVGVDLRGKFTGRGTIPGSDRHSTGSAKCDAYLWTADNYLATGKCDPCYMGHYLDAWWVKNPAPGSNWQNHTLTNHDFFITKRGFFWDLNVWGDETPIDDEGQKPGTDAATLKEILAIAHRQTQNREMIHVGGFTPWAFKYTNHPGAGGTHEPVETEWELVRVLSAYNAYVDADALGLGAMANASFLFHYPLPSSYAPVLAFTPEELIADQLLTTEGKPADKDFLLNYTGDYDSAAWAWNTLSLIWESPLRGKLPIAWAINPNLTDRAAPLFEFLYRTRTGNDHFMSGDSGAGYVNPTQLLPPREPSQAADGSAAWIHHCLKHYRRFGLRFTGFLINGLAGPITAAAERMYKVISPDGIVNQYGRSSDKLHVVAERMPVFELLADIDHIEEGAAAISKKATEVGDKPRFMVFRQILKTPQYYADLLSALKQPGRRLDPIFCDPHTFSCLARAKLAVSNDDQYTLLFDALPNCGRPGATITGEIGLRNDGWNSWSPEGHTLQIEILHLGAGDRLWAREIAIPHEVKPGEPLLVSIELPLPDFTGKYVVHLELARDGVPFSAKGGFATEKRVSVKRADVAASV